MALLRIIRVSSHFTAIFLISHLLFQAFIAQAAYPQEVQRTGKRRRQVYREDLSPLLGGKVPSGALDWFRLMFNNLDSRGISIPDGFILSNDRSPPDGVRSDERRIKLYSDEGEVDSSYTVRDPVATRHVIVPRAPPAHAYEEGLSGPYVHDISSIQAYFENPSDEYYRNLANLPGFIKDYQKNSHQVTPPEPQGPSSSESEVYYNQNERPYAYYPHHHHLYYPDPTLYQPSPPDPYPYSHYTRPVIPTNETITHTGCNKINVAQNSGEREPTSEPPSTTVPSPADNDEYETNFPDTLRQEVPNEKFHAQIPQKGGTEDEEKAEPEVSTDLLQPTPLPDPASHTNTEPNIIEGNEDGSSNKAGDSESYPVSATSIREKEFHFREPILGPMGTEGDVDGYTRFKNVLIDEIMSRLKASAFDGTTHHIITILPPAKLLTQRGTTKKREVTGRASGPSIPYFKERKTNAFNLMLKSIVKNLMEK